MSDPAPDSAWSACETALLERLLYKYRNQHRKANYFRKLVQVQRALRDTRAQLYACAGPTFAEEQADGSDGELCRALLTPTSAAHLSRLEGAVHSLVRCQRVILHSSGPLYALLSQTYFMSFALAALALLARLYAAHRSMLLPLLDKCITARQVAAAHSVGSSSGVRIPSCAQALDRALRTELDERMWLEQCAEVNDMFAIHTQPQTRASAKDALAPAVQTGAQVDLTSDGDSDEDESTPAADVAAAAPLPAQLKFFASPAPKAAPLRDAPSTSSARPRERSANNSHFPSSRAAAGDSDESDASESALDESEHEEAIPVQLPPPPKSRPTPLAKAKLTPASQHATLQKAAGAKSAPGAAIKSTKLSTAAPAVKRPALALSAGVTGESSSLPAERPHKKARTVPPATLSAAPLRPASATNAVVPPRSLPSPVSTRPIASVKLKKKVKRAAADEMDDIFG